MPRLFKFFGNAAGNAAGYSIGVATAPTLAPIVQELRNQTWSLHPDRPVDAGTLASGVSQGQVDAKWAKGEAAKTGINGDRFDRLVEIANVGPGVPTAFDLWRRGVIGEAGFRRAAKRQGIEPGWIDDLVKVKLDVLDPAQLAAAIHRGLIPDPGLLKGEQPDGPRKVEAYPVYDIDALDEAMANGYDPHHLGVLVGLQGLPMGPHEAAQAFFRGIITHGDYIAAFNESNSRNEWAQAVLEQSRQIPTARDFFENALRGYHDFEWALDQAKRHGMSEADATVIYQNQGRPMAVKQITQALARGGTFKPEPGELKDPYMASIVEGNVKPAYYGLALALRYTYPSAFALRGLVASKSITETEARDVLLYEGWEPTFAAKVAKAWASTKSTAAKEASATDELTLYDGLQIDRAELLSRLEALGFAADDANRKADVLDARRVVSARTAGITATRDAFVKHGASDDDTRTRLTQLGVHAWAQPLMIDAWRVARIAAAPDLTVAQITRAYTRGALSAGDATTALEAQGYSAAEAATLLGIAGPPLTVKQIQDAYKGGLRTRDEAAALLAALGFNALDASLLLGEAGAATNEAKIATDFKAGTLAQAAAVAMLETLGYSAAAAGAYLEAFVPPPPTVTP